MNTIKIENVEIIYNESDLRFGDIYLDNDKIVIPGGIFGDTFICIKDKPQIVALKLITCDSASFNGWNIYNIGIDEPYYNVAEDAYILGYSKLFPIDDILPLYIKDEINGFTNKVERIYCYSTKIIERGNIWNSLSEAIEKDNCFDMKSAKYVPNVEKYIITEIRRQMKLNEDDNYGN